MSSFVESPDKGDKFVDMKMSSHVVDMSKAKVGKTLISWSLVPRVSDPDPTKKCHNTRNKSKKLNGYFLLTFKKKSE